MEYLIARCVGMTLPSIMEQVVERSADCACWSRFWTGRLLCAQQRRDRERVDRQRQHEHQQFQAAVWQPVRLAPIRVDHAGWGGLEPGPATMPWLVVAVVYWLAVDSPSSVKATAVAETWMPNP
jgi:hypothetical protein